MDFYDIAIVEEETPRTLKTTIRPIFRTIGVTDIIIDNKDGSVSYWWDETNQRWSSSQDALMLAIDANLKKATYEYKAANQFAKTVTNYLDNSDSPSYKSFTQALRSVRTKKPAFDNHILFSDHTIEREDYATTKLSYRPDPTVDITTFLDGMHIFYDEENLRKLLWFIGATLTGDISKLQKFAYLYGRAGSGKGTTIKIIQMLFPKPYSGQISLEKLTGKSEFAFDGVRDIPVLFDPEVNLTKMTNDTPLLALTAHEPISVNKKFRDPETITFNGFLIAASNQPVRVRNIDAGITRRLIDIYQTGNKMSNSTYNEFMSNIPSQLPGIAAHAISIFKQLGPSYFNGYVSLTMLQQTNFMYRFVKEQHDQFLEPMPLSLAYELYNNFVNSDNAQFSMSRSEFQNEFQRFYDHVDTGSNQRYHGIQGKVWFVGFQEPENMVESAPTVESPDFESTFNYFESSDVPAQYASDNGTPTTKWDENHTIASELDQTKLHYIQQQLIVVDIDHILDTSLNPFQPTYGELSRSQTGIHFYYTYDGSLPVKSQRISPSVELKVYTGKQAIRRQFTKSNGIKNLTGLTDSDLDPYFKENKMYNEKFDSFVSNERQLRALITKALRKEIHDATKPNIDFIEKVITEAHDAGLIYNITDMQSDILTFAMSSTHQAQAAVSKVQKLISSGLLSTEPNTDDAPLVPNVQPNENSPIMFYDVEVFKNVFMFSYKEGDSEPQTLINPTQTELSELVTNKRLIGFNNYRYDDYIIYYALQGYSTEQLYGVSNTIINGKGSSGLAFAAHDLSYADIFDFATKKQSLKAWEVELGLPYDEVELDWTAPLPEDSIQRVAAYNRNDVSATAFLFDKLQDEFDVRLALSQLSGLPVNRTGNAHATAIIYTHNNADGTVTHVKPSNAYTTYTDLSETFPGYTFDPFNGSSYLGQDPSEGGYVYTKPGVYQRVIELDITQMHPTSIVRLNYFGEFTANYEAVLHASVALKHGDIDEALRLIPGLKGLVNKSNYKVIRKALKLVLVSAYGMTSAKFDNALRNPRNADNIIAKRGALFMLTLKEKLLNEGIEVVHIKTDSIKIADPTPEIISEIFAFGESYGYEFEIADRYSPFVLIDKAQLIGVEADENFNQVVPTSYHAIGTKFINPYSFKSLFTHEDFVLGDYRRTIQSRVGSLYLNDLFIGRIGAFVAATPEHGGGNLLIRKSDYDVTGKTSAPSGTKNHTFKRYETASISDIDFSYYEDFNRDLIKSIIKVSSPEESLIVIPDAAERYPDIYDEYNNPQES